MRRVAIVLVLTVAALWVPLARSAWACSCAEMTMKQQARESFGVFVGVARGSDGIDGLPTSLDTDFFVELVYKGDLAVGTVESVVHETQEGACGLTFAEGVRYTVFVYSSGDQLHTHSCSPTQEGTIRPRKLGLPAPGAVVPAPLVGGGLLDAWPLFALAGIAGIAATVAIRRRSRPS